MLIEGATLTSQERVQLKRCRPTLPNIHLFFVHKTKKRVGEQGIYTHTSSHPHIHTLAPLAYNVYVPKEIEI